MSVCQRNFMILESSNKKKWALHFICHFYFIFLQILFLYYFKKVYIHEKLEVKQNGTEQSKSWPFTEIVWEVELERDRKCLENTFHLGDPVKNECLGQLKFSNLDNENFPI